jgi:hypothetical protein
MSDIDDLPTTKTRPHSLRFNAVTGFLAVYCYNLETRQNSIVEIPPKSRWAIDMLTRERGYGRVTDAVFDMRLSPVGAPPPVIEDEDLFKTAVSMRLYSPDWGLVEWQTASALAVRAIIGLWETYKKSAEALVGDIPIVEIGTPRVVVIGRDTNKREFFAPQIDIVAWADREVFPAFRARPPTVALPQPDAGIALAAPLAARLGAAAAPAATAAPASAPKAGGGVSPKRTAAKRRSTLLDDDENPF